MQFRIVVHDSYTIMIDGEQSMSENMAFIMMKSNPYQEES